MIPVELLPYEEFHSAEFKIEKENQLTSNTLMLSCQLVLGNQTGAKY